MAAQAPQRPFRASHLRQVSTGSSGPVGDSPAYTAGESQAETSTSATQQSRNFAPQSFVLSIHDEQFSKEDVVLNHSPNRNVHEGDLLQLIPANGSPPDHKSINANADPNKRLSFLFKAPLQELLLKQPALQVSISQRVAVAFSFEKGIQVIVSTADNHACHATHVEIVFRDQYLARADMWHIVAQELAGTCIYRGQKIEFMGSIRAHIKTIFAHGKKVQSALFHQFTKPIFRSESARYVLFIQMSKEMWDFDAEGTGEIMFDKVINGFLPELFQRWRDLKVKHLVSIVLFTRMVYEGHTSQELTRSTITGDLLPLDSAHIQWPRIGREHTSKDFYRVVVSDLASGEWADILTQLKTEFKVFLKDISIRKPVAGDHLPLGEGLSSALADTPSHVIAGHPSAATRGNVLEAINLASSQFSSDYIDRDLVRTGVSVVVVSPGAGVFEVDYNLLVATTDNLIENGVGIDLVCLSRMPLHSVPLFKYHPPAVLPVNTLRAGPSERNEDEKTPTGSFVSRSSSETPPTVSASDRMEDHSGMYLESSRRERWSYGVPHWIDVSFWAPSSDAGPSQVFTAGKIKNKSSFDTPQHKTFVPRVKMYELQMMGVMENANNDIIVPRLTQTSRLLATATPNANSTTSRGSPKLDSKMSVSDFFGSQSHALHDRTHKLSTSVTSDRSIINQRSMQPQFQWMDDYDDLVYRHPLVVKKRAHKVKIGKTAHKNRQKHRYSPSLLGTSGDNRHKSLLRDRHSPDDESYLSREPLKHQASHVKQSKHTKTDDASFGKQTPRPQANKGTRQISFGPRGFPAKAVPSTEVTTKHEVGSLLSRGFKSGFTAKSAGLSNATTRKDLVSKRSVSPSSMGLNTERQSSGSESPQSRPIPIRNATAIRVTGDGEARLKLHGRDSHALDSGVKLQNRLAALQDLQDQEGEISIPELDVVDDVLPPPIALSPSTTLAPWLTLLNPSNPSKTKTALASRLGRWQHIFPRPLKTSQIKWKSLCSPAAVPLTTEDFPSAEQLAEEYEGITYDIDMPENSLSETAWSLATEILAFRLSRGFQLVIGPRVAESTKMSSMQTLDVFDERILTDTGSSVFLSRGSTIHRVSRVEANKIEVKQLFRHGGEIVRDSVPGSMLYKPLIRSILADEYEVQEISIAPHRSNFDWKTIDSFIIGHERPQAADFVDNLRPWRARFVLIPVEAPSSARRRLRGEDDEEEIRLEGIRKLTQVWQRFRYIPPDERRYQAPLRNRKDTNPLDILYQTRNPSAIVAAELENVAEGDATGRQEQLLPDSDLYQRSNFKIAPLAETIQSEKGVRMLDRRWHLRLHYNCFIGFELTSWLLQNFRDVDTRKEAVELGNELMTCGMFKHVEQRHNFRDGNYFYQIADEYRTPRPESRGWFGRGKASVPSTPMSEDLPKQLNITGRSRSSSKSNPSKDSEPTTPTGKKKQLGVALSKSLIYDVDHRKRSYRPELVNLHYDRLHNPDNCYHIRVEWMNTTPKLIQDAVVSWATSVDRFGLRLVELPLAEASSITSMHPFRAPHLVKLAQPPPERQPQSYFDSTSLGPQPRTEKNFYQKAIMKRFNFVLDLEAASDFPADVDVTYSWGKPDYRYPQYIHRSGMLIAQITDDGHFLLLANRLYNNRNARPPSYQDSSRADHASDSDQSRGPGFFRSSPHRGRGTHPHHQSPLHSPYSSPSVHATLHVPQNIPPSQNEPQGSTLISAPSFPKHIDPTRPSPTASSTPDATKQDFEAFCNNPEALSLFYDEVLSKASTPGPNTPFMGGKTPSKASDTGVESAIPTLALPGRLVDRSEEGSGKKADARARAVGGGSPGVGGRKGGDNG